MTRMRDVMYNGATGSVGLEEAKLRTDLFSIGYAYLRLSNDEAGAGESGSITNQRAIIKRYCDQNRILLAGEFVDDGWSGGNFERPGFQEMMRQLALGKANTVITKDLSRLGRDMREASYYAEQFYPEHGIRYIAIADNFDTEQENIMAPFQFAMNEVYLRDCSRKIKTVLKTKRESGQYCACPPFGYKKSETDRNALTPDENTAPTVCRIFELAAEGVSSRQIALRLNCEGAIPPLKYRALYRDSFSETGLSHVSDTWNQNTIKRILKNPVYLGHTVLGKTRKVSVKSEKKAAVPRGLWSVTNDTHEPLVTQSLFDRAQFNLGHAARQNKGIEGVRQSIFAGLVFCGKCGHALCSCGTVYKGERERYWYLSCTHQRRDAGNPCSGVRIRYSDLLELVRTDLNSLIALTEEEEKELAEALMGDEKQEQIRRERELKREKAGTRLAAIDRMVMKLYADNAEGALSDERLRRMVEDLESEAGDLKAMLEETQDEREMIQKRNDYDRFFDMVHAYTHIETLTKEILQTFVERIEVGEKVLPEGVRKATHPKQTYTQDVRIVYKIVGEMPGLQNNQA